MQSHAIRAASCARRAMVKTWAVLSRLGACGAASVACRGVMQRPFAGIGPCDNPSVSWPLTRCARISLPRNPCILQSCKVQSVRESRAFWPQSRGTLQHCNLQSAVVAATLCRARRELSRSIESKSTISECFSLQVFMADPLFTIASASIDRFQALESIQRPIDPVMRPDASPGPLEAPQWAFRGSVLSRMRAPVSSWRCRI